MNRRWLSLLHCLLVCLCAVPLVVVTATNTQPGSWIKVNEATTRFTPGDGVGKVSLAVENTANAALAAHVQFELLDPQDQIAASARVETILNRGANRVEGSLAISKLTESYQARRELLWYRLRYRVEGNQKLRCVPAADVRQHGWWQLNGGAVRRAAAPKDCGVPPHHHSGRRRPRL